MIFLFPFCGISYSSSREGNELKKVETKKFDADYDGFQIIHFKKAPKLATKKSYLYLFIHKSCFFRVPFCYDVLGIYLGLYDHSPLVLHQRQPFFLCQESGGPRWAAKEGTQLFQCCHWILAEEQLGGSSRKWLRCQTPKKNWVLLYLSLSCEHIVCYNSSYDGILFCIEHLQPNMCGVHLDRPFCLKVLGFLVQKKGYIII